MIAKSFSFKKLCIGLLLILSFALVQNAFLFSGFLNQPQAAPIEIAQAYENDISGSLSNNNFTNNNYSSTFPYEPTSWTLSRAVPSGTKAGIIDASQTGFQKNYDDYNLLASDYAQLSTTQDNRVLMINAKDAQISLGYTSTSNYSLSANSYYRISAFVRTNAEGRAGVYLTGSEFDNNAKARFSYLSTNNNWQAFTFYIATSPYSAPTAGIGLFLGERDGLGSKGFVMFDNISAKQISEDLYVQAAETAYQTKVDLRTTPVSSGQPGFVINGGFETNSLTGWAVNTSAHVYATNPQYSVQKVVNIASYSSVTAETPGYNGPGTNLAPNNNYALMINNKQPSSAGVKSNDILIKQHGIYKISFYLKTGPLTGAAAYAKLSGTVQDGATYTEEDPAPVFSAIFEGISNNNTSANSTNGWTQYAFYVCGNPYYDSKINLEFWLGSPDGNTAAGYAFFDSVKTELISYDQMTNGTSRDTNNKTLNLFNSPNTTISNGYFNFAENQDGALTYPLKAASWTPSYPTNTNGLITGIVDTQPSHFSANTAKYSGAANPGPVPDTSASSHNNVLMLGNTNSSYQNVTSTAYSLGADAYCKISVLIKTQGAFGVNGANITLVSNNVKLAEFTNISSPYVWQEYSFYIRGNLASNNISVVLGLGTQNRKVQGFVFFDNCEADTSITSDDYLNASEGTNIKKIDFLSGSLAFSSGDKNTNGFYDLNSYEGTFIDGTETTEATVSSGLIDASHAEYPGKPAGAAEKVLMISSGADVYYSYTSKLAYNLAGSSHYKVSVWVKTKGVRQTNLSSYTYNDDDERINDWGASISITGIDKQFTGINTKDHSKDGSNPENDLNPNTYNEWTEYLFYISTTAAVTANINLALGSAEGLTTGTVFFSNVTVTSLSEANMELEVAGFGESLPKNVIHIENTDANDDGTNAPGLVPFDWLLLPTLIMGVALIIAIVGFTVRRVASRRKSATYVSTKYDRAQTLLKDVERRDRRATVDRKLKLLHEELSQAELFLADEMAEYEKQMSAYKTAKEIAKNDPEISLEKLEDKYAHFDKYSLQLEEKIAIIKDDIAALEYERDRMKRETDKALEKAASVEKPKVKKPKQPIKTKK